MSTSAPQKGFRSRLRQRLERFRQGSASAGAGAITANSNKYARHTVSAARNEISNTDLAVISTELASHNGSSSASASASGSGTAASISISTAKVAPLERGNGVAVAPSDLWSKAYSEAVRSMGPDVDVTVLQGENIAQLFKALGEADKGAADESAFLRGVRYLNTIQVPLERFKLALDLTAPLTTFQNTASGAFGLIRSVTAVAISISTADHEFAKNIGQMLEHISYIDDCDTLGQREDRADIHRALVSVYQILLEFYVSAHGLLVKRGARLALAVISDTGTLPDIVKDFLRRAEHLQKVVGKATFDTVQDIKAMLYDEKISQWLGGDKPSQQRRYHADLQSLRADPACEFLLEKPEFKTWYQVVDSQQLAILGDMGSGKSVMMSFLIDELFRRKTHQLPQPVILCHYCQDDETGHASYIFSSLLLSLLEQRPGLKKPFFEWCKKDLATGYSEPSTNVHKMAEFFQTTVGELDRPLWLVIDGLDECDMISRDILFKVLQSLSKKTSGLKVVLSCRPWEEILDQLDGVPKIDIGSDPKRDSIIAEKTVETELMPLAADIKQLVVERLSGLAQGSAIWTKMTVKFIAARKIRAFGRMKKFLDDMQQPQQLSELYANLFIRCAGDDPESQHMAAMALEILTNARRRLSILELAWAVALGSTADADVTTVAEVAELVDHQGVMVLIQPFVASVDFGDVKKHQVTLVHQSAKEFVLNGWVSSQRGLQNVENPLPVGSKTAASPNTSRLEKVIFDICVRYLLLDEINNVPLLSDEQLAIEELPQEVDLFGDDDDDAAAYTIDCSWEDWEVGMIRYDPADRGFGEFLVYASCYWIIHFESITAEPLPDLDRIETLCQANSTRLQNWTSQNSRPDCVVQARFDFDGSLYDPLSITSLYGSEALLLKMLETCEFDSDRFLPNTAMLAADQILQWGDLSRLQMLLFGRGTGHHLRNLEFVRLIIDSWRFCNRSHGQDWDAAFAIVNDLADILVSQGWGNELLCEAASQGCLPVIERLMKAAQQNHNLKKELLGGIPRGSTHQAHQSIGEAVRAGHVDVVEYLLEQEGIEAHLHHRNSNSENVLHLASTQCNPAMFRSLAPRFLDGLSQRDRQDRTALMRVVASPAPLQDRLESARILLSHQAALSTDDQQAALQMAEQMNDERLRSLLYEFSQVSLDGVSPLLPEEAI